MMLEAIEDEESPDHEEMLEWVGGDFDPVALPRRRTAAAFPATT